VLLDHGSRDAQAYGDFIQRPAFATVQEKTCLGIGWDLLERELHFLGAALEIYFQREIGLDCEALVGDWVGDISRLRDLHPDESVLMKDVACDREEIGLGTANLLVPVDTQEPEKDLLGQVAHVGRVPQARREVAPELASISADDVSYEGLALIDWQWVTGGWSGPCVLRAILKKSGHLRGNRPEIRSLLHLSSKILRSSRPPSER
jgi:hypothetical protein